jgi:Kef-type K+ transport system membrane component KefB
MIVPLFFVYSGLNTRIGLLSSPGAWALTAGIVLLASVGKFAACSTAARLSGWGRRDAWAIGSLMNARGLMELIVLNIGLERGLITPTFFTMMVVMAIVTTVAAGPLFDWIYRPEAAQRPLGIAEPEAVS